MEYNTLKTIEHLMEFIGESESMVGSMDLKITVFGVSPLFSFFQVHSHTFFFFFEKC
jgi:hypothetical protein